MTDHVEATDMASMTPNKKNSENLSTYKFYEFNESPRHGLNRFNGFAGSDMSLFGGSSPDAKRVSNNKVKSDDNATGINDTNQQNFNHLIHIKDHTQTIAVISMFVLHVAWLKNIIDTGESGGKFYYRCSIGLVSTALAFLIAAGLIVIYIAYLRYYQLSDQCSSTTCSMFKRKSGTSEKNNNLNASVVSNEKLQENSIFEDENEGEDQCCLTSFCNNSDDYVIDLHSTLVQKALKANIQAANLNMETQWLVEKVTRLNNELQKYENAEMEDEAANKDYLQNIRDQLMEAQSKRNDMEQKRRIAMQLDSQVALLGKHVNEIKENRMIKKTFFWMNVLNVIMYIVLLLNIAIVGVGFAHDPTPEHLVEQ